MSLNTTAIGSADVHGSVFGVFWGSCQFSPFRGGGSGRRALSNPAP